MNTAQPDTRIHNPAGVRVVSAVQIPTSAQAAWAMVGDFGGFDRFIPALETIQVTGEGLGRVRHKTFKDGNFAIEQLNSHSTSDMTMTWTLIHTSLPVGNLWAAMQVVPQGLATCEASWTIQAEPASTGDLQDPEAFRTFLQGFADGAMNEVKRLLS